MFISDVCMLHKYVHSQVLVKIEMIYQLLAFPIRVLRENLRLAEENHQFQRLQQQRKN